MRGALGRGARAAAGRAWPAATAEARPLSLLPIWSRPTLYSFLLRAVLCCAGLRSARSLLGNTLQVDSGAWEGTHAGVGAGADSFYEYLLKVRGTADREGGYPW